MSFLTEWPLSLPQQFDHHTTTTPTQEALLLGSDEMPHWENVIATSCSDEDILMLQQHVGSVQSRDSGNGSSLDSDDAKSDVEWKVPVAPALKKRSVVASKRARKQQVERPTCCVVCSRSASYCHFDVPSCLGCRSFFRRTVLHQRNYVCHRSGDCRIDQGELCRACRFDRCVLGGMNVRGIHAGPREAIDLDVASVALEQRRVELIERKNGGAEKPAVLLVAQMGELRLLDSLLYVEQRLQRIRRSQTTLPRHCYQQKCLMEIASTSDNVLARADSFSESPMEPQGADFFAALISKGHKHVMEEQCPWFAVDSFLCAEMAKTLPAVGALSLEDKISLLCGNLIGALVFSQNFYSLATQSGVMMYPDGFSPLYFGRSVKTERLFQHHLAPFKRIQMTDEEFLLLRTIILLQTTTVDLSREASETLQSALDKYTKALMCYERVRLGEAEAGRRFSELMFFLDVAMRSTREHRNFLLVFLVVLNPSFERIAHPAYVESIILGVSNNPRTAGQLEAGNQMKQEIEGQW